VWAATSKSLEGTGGLYLEECQISKPYEKENGRYGPGYATWAYDEEKAGKLWKASMELLGLQDEAGLAEESSAVRKPED
jgi:hypothetical protein